ncbi:MAG: transporter substrate-binding domain-containing protein [Rhodanobacter sp.]|nr:MAG: transporter substrate-binding domain-containing protein [Rhodanobacter sp.]TAM01383.1 MAG: transporter substrate-binding domain-containing protein [Rhodanobacter sp.]TAM40728.1 MAG: transporter substrate-binding domain-containing protein [Rhodanobacter sp.]
MKKHSFKPARHAWLVTIATVLLYGGTVAATDLSVCIDKSSPIAAVDTSLAHAVAQHEGVVLHIHVFDGSGGDEGFALKGFNKLAHSSCSLVLGFPVDTDSGTVPPGLLATSPYGHTGFVLVTPHGSKASSLAQLPNGSDVAITYLTPPNLYFADHPNVQADVHLSDNDAFSALEKHQVSAAMLWQPTVIHYLASRHETARFSYHELDEPHARFNLVALYDSDHAAAAAAFQRTIVTMSDSGELAQLLAPYAQAGEAKPLQRSAAAMARSSNSSKRNGHCCSARKSVHERKALPALFTAVQADSGKQKYKENCARCHGPDLEGRAGPALTGANFASPKSKFSVSDIFAIITQNMPSTAPGSLSHPDYVEIMAFLMQQNGYPAGKKALTYDEGKQSKVSFVYQGK